MSAAAVTETSDVTDEDLVGAVPFAHFLDADAAPQQLVYYLG